MRKYEYIYIAPFARARRWRVSLPRRWADLLLPAHAEHAVGGRRAEGPPEVAGEVRLVGEAGRMRRLGDAAARGDRPDRHPYPAPGAVAAEGDTHLLGEQVLEARRRQSEVGGEVPDRRALVVASRQLVDDARDPRIDASPRSGPGEGQEVVQSLGGPARAGAVFPQLAHQRELTRAADERSAHVAHVAHERDQRIGAVDARLDVEDRERLAAHVEFVEHARGNHGGAARQPVAAVNAQAKGPVDAGEKDRRAVLVHGVVGQLPREEEAARVHEPEGPEPGRMAGSTFVQAPAVSRC